MGRRVLIADPTATHRIALKAVLRAARYSVAAVPTAEEALQQLSDGGADIVLASDALPDMSPQDMIARIAGKGPAAPPTVMTTDDPSPDQRMRLMSAGAVEVMSRPLERRRLLTHMRSLLRVQESHAELRARDTTARRLGFAEEVSEFSRPPRIALVDRGRPAAASFQRRLPHGAFPRAEVLRASEALNSAAGPDAPEIFVLCDDGDDEGMLWLLPELRSMAQSRRAGILVEYGTEANERPFRALDLGANAVIARDALPEERALRIERLIAMKREGDRLRARIEAGMRLAACDDLTGLWNRRYAMTHLTDLAARPHADGRAVAVLGLDVDRFKEVNDRFGHPVGDAVLREVAARLRQNVRDVDLVARMGGEEFLVVMPDAAPEEAMIAAERLRLSMADDPVRLKGSGEIPVTVSIGICCLPDITPMRALDLADAALYDAKRHGRNQCRFARPEDVSMAPEAPPAVWPAARF